MLLCTAAVDGAEPQDAERLRLAEELKRYHGLVDAYRKGDDESVGEILAWDQKRLTAVIAATRTSVDEVRWDEARVRTAAMLHTDAAMRVLDGDDRRLTFQLAIAAHLLEKAGPDAHAFARRWYVTVVGVLRDRALVFVAEGLLERARKHIPADAVILYESGVLQEHIGTYAAFINVIVTEIAMPGRAAVGMRPMEKSVSDNRAVVDNRRALERAAEWLRDSFQADGSSELTQLHLGRVDLLRGKYDEAAKLLGRLATSSADVEIAYLATMFLGGMQQRRGRHAEAADMYREAVRKIPATQSAHIALSETLQKLGRGDEARDMLMTLLGTPAASRNDPWWWYLQEPIGQPDYRLDLLRRSVRP